jgi:hypothetical protein
LSEKNCVGDKSTSAEDVSAKLDSEKENVVLDSPIREELWLSPSDKLGLGVGARLGSGVGDKFGVAVGERGGIAVCIRADFGDID